ncbi:uncharacterized protein K460DRAFT_380562 [Cucurbitaria berberidis CBS 394.84]|uniref:SH3 domain-containing protein n=1 Tax=Cucurbitaria berberidis CBS 394.84 TaxID=1168544 RepID=A0A9P4L3C4_9PLEO|nr:uncharacterized protein K460DRAFT_380562 [Cucurbitaria berberidis CBS 394.84]KAF1840771.1 hypothetical protein K460DRAFT_380562 [Cucurbitaria berberidis CBS 394.84]
MRQCLRSDRPGDLQHPDNCGRPNRTSRHKQPRTAKKHTVVLSILAASLPVAMAQQNCISLQGSTACPAFSTASISTNLTGDFSFLSFVSDVKSFDDKLRNYIATSYSERQYKNILGCSNVNLTNTTNLYARYTTTVLCNAIVQNSRVPCGLSNTNATPLCAGACADFAISEQVIVSSPELCGTAGNNAVPQIRSDFARCSNPTEALSGRCIEAASNEGYECGYQGNLQGLCSYCSDSTVNSTNSCCINANVNSRCVGVELPTTVSMPPLFPSSTSSATPSSTSAGAGTGRSGSGLSGGAIAGIVIGSLVGAALILAAVIFCCLHARKQKNRRQADSIFNTPSPPRRQSPKGPPMPPMSYADDGLAPPSILPGARVQRMSALEGSRSSGTHSDGAGVLTAFGDTHIGAYDSPESIRGHLASALPKRGGSLSSRSALDSSTTSPHSGSDQARNFSSPDGVASGQSEQLQFFKDYYSQDDIHPNDTVATLWAYQPRAGDEFELERGDMLKVVGIWDDGWATGIRLTESAEQWESRKAEQRDSGVSNGSRRSQVETDGEIKAFPLVCVCLPQHWRKTIEGDSTDTHGSGGDRPPPSP